MEVKKIGLGVAVVAIAAGGGWFLMQNKTVNKVDEAVNAGIEKAEQAVEKYSMNDLLARGSDLKCTYTSKSEESGTAEVTVYISGKKMRADSSGTSSEGIEFESAMILNEEVMYVRTPGQKEGIKMPVSGQQENKETWKGEASYLDPEQRVDYKCIDWGVDPGVFSLPAGVEFSDLGEMMKSQCVVCDNLSGEQRDTCRTSLNCD